MLRSGCYLCEREIELLASSSFHQQLSQVIKSRYVHSSSVVILESKIRPEIAARYSRKRPVSSIIDARVQSQQIDCLPVNQAAAAGGSVSFQTKKAGTIGSSSTADPASEDRLPRRRNYNTLESPLSTSEFSQDKFDSDKKIEVGEAQYSEVVDRYIHLNNGPRALVVILDRLLDSVDKRASLDMGSVAQDVQNIQASCFPDSDEDIQLDASLLASQSSKLISWLDSLQPLLLYFVRRSIEGGLHRIHRRHLKRLLERILNLSSNTEILSQSRQRIVEKVVAELALRRRWRSVVEIGRAGRDLLGGWTQALLHNFLQAAVYLEEFTFVPAIESLPSLVLPLPLATYNLLLRAHLSSGSPTLARNVLQSMQQYQIDPDRLTYQAIIEGYRVIGQDGAIYKTLLQKLEQLGLSHTSDTLNGFIDMLIAQNDLASAHDLFALFDKPVITVFSRNSVQSLIAPTSSAPSSKLAEAARCGSSEISSSTSASNNADLTATSSAALVLPPSLPLVPDGRTFSLFMQGYSALGDFDRALDFFVDMTDLGLKLSPLVSQALIKAYRNAGSPESARSLIRQVEGYEPGALSTSHSTRGQASSRRRSYLTLSPDVLAKDGLKGLRKMMDSLTRQGTVIDTKSITLVLAYLSKSAYIGAIRLSNIIEKLRQGTKTPYTISDLNVLLHAFRKREDADRNTIRRRWHKDPDLPDLSPSYKGDDVVLESYLNMIRQLHAQGVKPDAYTCAILMQRFANNGGSPSTLWSYFRWQVLDRGLQPDGHHLSALMIAFMNAGDPYGARRLMDRAEAMGIQPKVQHYTVLINDLLVRDQKDLAESLFLQMRERGIQSDLHVYTILASWSARHGLIEQVYSIVDQVQQNLPEVKQPNVVLESIVFSAHNIRSEYKQAQLGLKKAFEAGLLPDRKLIHANTRVLKQMRNKSRKMRQDEPEAKDLEEAIFLAEMNRRGMYRSVELSGDPNFQEPSKVINRNEIELTIQAIIKNSVMTGTEVDAEGA